MTLIKKIILKYELEVLTGMHIGGSRENVEIGGLDKTIIRRGSDNLPYIPGSSLKGKIRCLLEQIAGCHEVGGNPNINQVFGFAKQGLPSKLIVRDAPLSAKSKDELSASPFTDLDFTEIKFENSIDRVRGTAENPRQIERIPAGAKFDVEFVINVSEKEGDEQNSITMLENGIKALENDYLGGNGSRGYGQVKFKLIDKNVVDFTGYIQH